MTPQDRVLADEQGLLIQRGDGRTELRMCWDEIYAVSFSKIDAVETVVTYLTFDYDYGEFVEITDRWEGFARLVQEIPEHLTITSLGWLEAMQAALPGEAPVTIYQSVRG